MTIVAMRSKLAACEDILKTFRSVGGSLAALRIQTTSEVAQLALKQADLALERLDRLVAAAAEPGADPSLGAAVVEAEKNAKKKLELAVGAHKTSIETLRSAMLCVPLANRRPDLVDSIERASAALKDAREPQLH